MAVEITPEPTPQEREALLQALATLGVAPAEPSAWWQAGVHEAIEGEADD